MKPIPYGTQSINEDDVAAVVEALHADFLTQGPRVAEFEKLVAAYLGVKHAIAVNSGTAALHLACMAIGLKPGQKIITTPITFVASANAARYCGAEVDFVDIDRNTRCLSADLLEQRLSSVPAGTYSAIVAVDFGGYAADWERLREIADRHKLYLIEDACHALGGGFRDSTGRHHQCASCSFADIAVLSFHPVKHVTTGEGGMILTNDDSIRDSALLFRTHGITKDAHLLRENHGAWYYEMQDLGYNYRITDIQCALGISQFGRLDQGNKRRNEIATRYDEAFRGLPIVVQEVSANRDPAYHLYVIETERRDELYSFLKSHAIHAQVHYVPVNMMPYYKDRGSHPESTPQALGYYQRCLSLPMFPALTEEQQDYVIGKIKEFFTK